MQSAIHQGGAHGGHGGHGTGEHHGHSPYGGHGGGRGKPGSKSGPTKQSQPNPAASALQGSSIGGDSSGNIPVAVAKRGLPKSTGMLTGDAK